MRKEHTIQNTTDSKEEHMAWSKEKKLLESFLSPSLYGRVQYLATSYRYMPDKAGQCYIAVDNKHIFNMNDETSPIRWYQTEQEIKNDPSIEIPISNEDINVVRNETKGTVPENRLKVIVRNRKISQHAKELLSAQAALCKTDFNAAVNRFLSVSIEESLSSRDILLNVLALVDRRVGKKRLLSMTDRIKLKHPIVQFFYELRLSVI